jgi:hypothetical protein
MICTSYGDAQKTIACVPVATSHIMHWLSTDPEINDALSGDHARSRTSLT